jgi:ubiquitin-activating enzyme E1
MLKVHCVKVKTIEEYRSGFVNFANAGIQLTIPLDCRQEVCSANGRGFTLWDKWIVEGDLTVNEYIDALRKQFELDVDALMIGSELVFCSFFPPDRFEKYANKKITDIWVEDAKLSLPKGRDAIRVIRF